MDSENREGEIPEMGPIGANRSIVLLVTGTQRRGAEVFGEQLATSLARSGWETHLIALTASESPATIGADPLFPDKVNLAGLNLGVTRRLRSRIRSISPAVVLAGGGATLKYSVAGLAGLRGRPRLVYSSIGEPEYWASTSLSRRLTSLLLGRTDLVTAVSRATAEQLERSFGVRQEKIRVAYTGVPASYLEVRGAEPSSELRVLYLGSLSAEKDPVSSLEAWLEMSRPSAIRFVGAGPLLGDLTARSADLEGVEVVGPVNDVVPYLEWADVLVMTSQTEGLPGVVLEAAAAGVPAVAWDVGGVSEAVVDGQTGFVIARGDVSGLADALDQLAGDRRLLESFSHAAREGARSRFMIDDAVRRYEAVLAEVVAAG